MKKAATIWVDKITKVEDRHDMGMTITFEILDPLTGERHVCDLIVPPEGTVSIRNHVLT